MNLEQHVNHQFAAHIETASEAATRLAGPVAHASSIMVNSLLQGGKIICCGNGGSASAAQHFVAKMINRYERERPGLPAIALNAADASMSAVADELGYSQVFAKQLSALGHPGDVLLAICTRCKSDNMVLAIEAAIERQMHVVALTGGDGGQVGDRLREQDIEIRVPASDIARVEEIHLLGTHCLCSLIDTQLLGS